jgi:DNA polymerase-3 subunit beta
VVERRQTLPILSYLLLRSDGQGVSLTGTDLEVEITVKAEAKASAKGEWMLPARKLLDICRSLPGDSVIDIRAEGTKVQVKAGRSRFSLLTLPVSDFPTIQTANWDQTITLSQQDLRGLLDETHFCMAQQDVRYYLNGVLLETADRTLRSVATDGHRLAISERVLEQSAGSGKQIILPRKGVQELIRILEDGQTIAKLEISSNHLRLSTQGLVFTSKLIDGRYPDYTKVIPGNQSKSLMLDREPLRESLARVAILSNEKYRGVRLALASNSLQVSAHNPEQEEAQEELSIDYRGEALEIGFNVNYLMEALNALPSEKVQLGLNDPNSSCTLQAPGTQTPRYIIMPMRL